MPSNRSLPICHVPSKSCSPKGHTNDVQQQHTFKSQLFKGLFLVISGSSARVTLA